MLAVWTNSFSPQRETGVFCLLALCCTGWGAVASAHTTVQTTAFLLCSPQGFREHQALSVSQDMWERSQSLGQHLEKLEHLIHSLALSLPRKKLGAEGVLPILLLYLVWGLLWAGVSSFPTSFDVAGFSLAWSAGASQLVSRFLTKGIDPSIAVESVDPRRGGSRASYSAILLTFCKFILILWLVELSFYF